MTRRNQKRAHRSPVALLGQALLLDPDQQAADRRADALVPANDGQGWRELRIAILNSDRPPLELPSRSGPAADLLAALALAGAGPGSAAVLALTAQQAHSSARSSTAIFTLVAERSAHILRLFRPGTARKRYG
jgi:hypothetical protein